MIKIFLNLILIIISFSSNSLIPLKSLSEHEVKCEFKELMVIGNEVGTEIFRIDGIAVDMYNNIYVSDHYDYSIKKFNKEGKFIGKIGRRGYGPGEFQSPSTITIYKDTLVVIDSKSSTIQFYNTNLEFIRSFKNPQTYSINIKFNSQGELFVVSHTTDPNERLVVYNTLGKRLKKSIT